MGDFQLCVMTRGWLARTGANHSPGGVRWRRDSGT